MGRNGPGRAATGRRALRWLAGGLAMALVGLLAGCETAPQTEEAPSSPAVPAGMVAPEEAPVPDPPPTIPLRPTRTVRTRQDWRSW